MGKHGWLKGTISRSMRIPFVRDVLTMQVGTVLYTAATLLSSVAFARLLGIEGYGAYAVVTAFTGTAMLCTNIGQGPALLVFFAEEYGKSSRSGMATVLRNFLHIWAFNAMLLLLLAVTAPIITDALYGSRNMGLLARVIFLYAITDAGNSMTLIILQAVKQVQAKVVLEQSANLTFLGLAVVFLLFGSGVEGIVLAQLVTSIGFLSVSAVRLHTLMRANIIPSLREIRQVPITSTWQYLRQGILFSIEKNLGNLFPQGLFFALSLVAPASAVGVMRIGVQLSNLPRTVLLAPVGELSTTVLAATRASGITRLRMNAARIIKHGLALQAGASLTAAIVLPFAVYLLYGTAYLDAIPVAWWLLLLSLPAALCIVNSPIIRVFRKTHLSILQAALSWAIMIPMLLLLSNIFTPSLGFIAAYGIGQILPLSMTAYIFMRLLRRPSAPPV